MTRGAPDWSDRRKVGYVTTVQDMGELAVRLGSPVSFDRRGDVWYLDTFEDGIGNYTLQGSGAGNGIVASTAWSVSGAVSAKLTAGSDLTRLATMFRVLYLPPLGRLGFSTLFSPDANTFRYEMQITVNALGRQLQYVVGWRSDTGALYYINSAAAEVAIATVIDVVSGGQGVAALKLVIDATNHNYAHVIFGNTAYSLAGIAGRDFGATAQQSFIPQVNVFSNAAVNGITYVDSWILTHNEP